MNTFTFADLQAIAAKNPHAASTVNPIQVKNRNMWNELSAREKAVFTPKEDEPDEPRLHHGLFHPLQCAILAIKPNEIYDKSPDSSKYELERRIASELDEKLNGEFAAKNGTGRGWVKKGIREWLMPYAAGAIKGAPKFSWNSVFEDKNIAGALDYICVVGCFQLAIWNKSEKKVAILPTQFDMMRPRIIQIHIDNDSGFVYGKNDIYIESASEWIREFNTSDCEIEPTANVTGLSAITLTLMREELEKICPAAIEAAKATGNKLDKLNMLRIWYREKRLQALRELI
jgi:hypothetical protein